jgi:hypothetical protein
MLTPSSVIVFVVFSVIFIFAVVLVVLGLLTDEGIGCDRVIGKDGFCSWPMVSLAAACHRRSAMDCMPLEVSSADWHFLLFLYLAIGRSPLSCSDLGGARAGADRPAGKCIWSRKDTCPPKYKDLLSSSGPCYLAATYSDSLRIFFRARFRAKACFTRRFAPGFR